MSNAVECDKCGALYKTALGCLTLREVSLDNGERDKEGAVTQVSWADIDLCKKCSQEVLVLIGPCLNDLEEILSGPSSG